MKHEIKICKRCDQSFECKVGNITQCDCFKLDLTNIKDVSHIKYDDCICCNCLMELSTEGSH